MDKSLDRRDFLKGMGLVSAGAVGVGALAAYPLSASGIVGNGIVVPIDRDLAISPAGDNYPWPANPPEISDADVEEEVDVDVIVCGLGVSGCAAMRAAAEGGAKVIAFEKGATPQCRSSQYAYINGPHSEAWGLHTFTAEELMDALTEEARQMSYAPRFDIWVRWANESAKVLDEWYCDIPGFIMPATKADFIEQQMGPPAEGSEAVERVLTLDANMPQAGGTDQGYREFERAAYPVTVFMSDHQAVLNGQVAIAEGLGSEARFGHFAEKLIKEGDRIVGAYARNAATGKYVKANASKGVILTTGDCFGNEDMVRYFRPDMIENEITSQYTNRDVEDNICNTGDGYKMGNWVGAGIQQHQASMQHIMGSGAYLRLNKLGKRFMPEDINNVNEEYQIEIQPDRCYYLIFDSKIGTPEEEQMPGHLMSMFLRNLDSLQLQGETIEELLDKIGDINKEEALASIARYNELVAKGFDEDFGKNPRYLTAVNAGPFYAMKVSPSQCLVMMGGLCSDKEAHVLNTNNEVIPGFYAGGNIQGNRFVNKYPFKFGGCSHCIAMFYGYVAGQNAAKGV